MKHFFQYQNYQIVYRRKGAGEKLFFFHGWPTSGKLWNAQMDEFGSNFETIAIDSLGFGESDKPIDHEYSFTRSKQLLDAFFEEILDADEQVNLVAHDIGGPPTILWANENQFRVSKLILLNTVLYPLKSKLDRLSHVFFSTPVVGNVMVSKYLLKYIIYSVSRKFDAAFRSKTRTILGDYAEVKPKLKLKTILEPMAAGRRNELLTLASVVQNMQVDKFLIIATGDPLCYDHIKKLSEEQPEIPRILLKGCGHYIPIERPDELNAALKRILRESF